MAILSTAKIVGMLASAKKTGKQILNAAGEYVAEVVEDFMSGFAGYGWKIWEYVSGKWKLEIDSIVVRETMTVFELLIQKIRAVKGALGITQANGKIKSAILDDAKQNWLITIEEDEMSFVAHDIIRCQNWQNGTLKGYWVEISEIRKIDGVDTIVIPVSEFSGSIDYIDGMEAVVSGLSDMSIPTEGDEIIQFGNTININRQSAIYLHADEGGQPAIDILFGINSKSFAGCVKMRIGGDIPGANGLKGFYCENGLIKGTDSSGHTVYCIYPDGTAEFGDGSARFATDKSGYIAGGAISWKWDDEKNKFVCTMGDVILGWDNLSPEAKENLKGSDGTGIESVDVEYSKNSSGTEAPTLGWQTTAPSWENGKYIWSRTRITLTDGTISYTEAACISGGKGISSIVEQYYLSSSSSSLADGDWSTERPAWKNGWYVWTRSVITYTDDTVTTTEAVCVTGEKGQNGADGVNGKDGTSIVWQGSFVSHPANPQNGWAYRNTTDGKSYVYQDGVWYQMTIDGVDGANGKDGTNGLSIVWKGDLSTPPVNPEINWVYRDIDNGKVYIYTGTAWALMVADGNDGASGADGSDGLSVFITYHDGESQPEVPTEDGTLNGWHTNATDSVVWMSQKVAESASSGSWGNPIKIKGDKGEDGADGQDAVMFAIEFYMNGIRVSDIPCDIHGTSISGNTVIAKLLRISGSSKEDYTPDRWRVSYLKEGVEVLSIQPLESLNFINISLEKSLEYDSIAVMAYEKLIPDYVLITEASISKVMANVPDWLIGWDTNKVQIGSNYMISPKLFTGKNTGTAEEPILTGIVQGDKCITINGVERSGIFALVNNEVMFELDPESQKYKFNGEVNATSGVFKNIQSPNGSFNIDEAGNISIIGKISTSLNGTRIEIDPDSNSFKMYNQDDNEVGNISFVTEVWNEKINYLPRIKLNRYLDNELISSSLISDSSISLMSQATRGSENMWECLINPINGIFFSKNGVTTKHYGVE
ncbi:hypothetical protein [Bacteroides cellulosilyticus]|jgi:hypothetical protein|uniref:hypothetical protein n=1 Tax=Bacteroides cellulosilyticus TaxID=246787 RepID=UPI001E3CADD1|nr:hypothetical protein [Bacteroides cellulosilyticus]DAO41326.1 MAG TPA: tail protein [Caudoviricetes sp.]